MMPDIAMRQPRCPANGGELLSVHKFFIPPTPDPPQATRLRFRSFLGLSFLKRAMFPPISAGLPISSASSKTNR
jgi:hypothetical protein